MIPDKARLGDIYEVRYYSDNPSTKIYFHAIGYVEEIMNSHPKTLVVLRACQLFVNSGAPQDTWKTEELNLLNQAEKHTKGTSKIDSVFLGTKEERPEYFL